MKGGAASAPPPSGGVRFVDRQDAGRRLAAALARWREARPVVLGLPRGGVPVAYEVALALEAPLDVLVVRKLRAPEQPELGLGAVTDGDHPEAILNEQIVGALRVPEAYLRREIAAQLAEVRRRQARFRGGRPAIPLAGRTAIVVDDGVATGGTVRAAIRGLRRASPRTVVLAVPVAAADAVPGLEAAADAVVCLAAPEDFTAVGQYYDDFREISDAEVIACLERAARRAARSDGSFGLRSEP